MKRGIRGLTASGSRPRSWTCTSVVLLRGLHCGFGDFAIVPTMRISCFIMWNSILLGRETVLSELGIKESGRYLYILKFIYFDNDLLDTLLSGWPCDKCVSSMIPSYTWNNPMATHSIPWQVKEPQEVKEFAKGQTSKHVWDPRWAWSKVCLAIRFTCIRVLQPCIWPSFPLFRLPWWLRG